MPLLAGCYQFLLAGVHGFRDHRRAASPAPMPRVAVIVPAWNEAAVIGRTIDRLMRAGLPAPTALRVYVVDDASTDDTPEVVRAQGARSTRAASFHLRREHGGQGKAHTLNHGLAIRAEDWYEAVLIIDADVIFTAPLAAPDGAPPRRPEGRRGHRLHQGGQPARRTA